MQNIPWQGQEVLAVFERMNSRPGDSLPIDVLWKSILRANVLETGLRWLAQVGFLEWKQDATSAVLTEVSYKVITGEELAIHAKKPT